VSKERPQGKKTKFYCIRFFPAGDYAWVMPKDLSRLKQHEIEAYINEPYRKSGDLLKGYQAASNPDKWEQEHQALVDAQNEEVANADVDQLDESEGGEDDDDGSAKAKSKKRKRDSEATSTKKPKAAKKKDTADGTTRRKIAGSTKGSKATPKSKAGVESEDDGEADDAVKQPTKKTKLNDDEESGDQASGAVKSWRHKLQKSFLTKGRVLSADEMPPLDDLFKTIENFDMSVENLKWSKIGKVMRHITKLPEEQLPRNDEFKFRERAQALVDNWSKVYASTAQPKNGKDTVDGQELDESTANGKPLSATKDAAAMDVDAKPADVMTAPADAAVKTNGEVAAHTDPVADKDTISTSADATMDQTA